VKKDNEKILIIVLGQPPSDIMNKYSKIIKNTEEKPKQSADTNLANVTAGAGLRSRGIKH